MAVTVTHATVTAVPDDPAYDIGSDEWNAAHTVTNALDKTGDTMTGSLHIKQSGYLIFEDSSGNEVGRVRFDPPNTPDAGGYSTFVGTLAGNAIDTSAAVPSGRYNTFVGHKVGYLCSTGYYNTGVGTDTLQVLSTGYQNTAVGSDALLGLTDGHSNTAVGFNALQQSVHGVQNVAIGREAGYASTSSYNVFMGTSTGRNTTADYQTMIGYNAGSGVTSGAGNVFIGINAGSTGTSISTGAYNTFVGFVAGAGADISNSIVIGANAQADNSNTAVIGASGTAVKLGINMTAPGAWLHLPAGSTTVAPLKFTSGTNETTAEAGAMEYNGTNLFFTRSGTTREGVLTESAVTTETVTSDTTVTVNINGTTYKLLAKA